MTQDIIDYHRIEKAIHYIRHHQQDQPSLEEIASYVGVSAYHFQKIFTKWAGVSPKKFMQYLTLSHAKALLKTSKMPLLDVAYEAGLSGTGRLHDLFINIEAMTPGDYKNGGAGLEIFYEFYVTIFGDVIIASTQKGICHLFFINDKEEAFQDLCARFPNASYICQSQAVHHNALHILSHDKKNFLEIPLHLRATPFQLKVWEALLTVPEGRLTTYGDMAKTIENPKAARAVGTAIGSNPVAVLIPCHRVIQSTGHLGGYMWGSDKKSALIGWESASCDFS